MGPEEREQQFLRALVGNAQSAQDTRQYWRETRWPDSTMSAKCRELRFDDLHGTRMDTGCNRVLGPKKRKINGLFFLRNEAKKLLKTKANGKKGAKTNQRMAPKN